MNVSCILSFMFFILNKLISSFVYKTIVIVWLSLRLKMSCFSHQGFWVVVEEGWSTHGCGLHNIYMNYEPSLSKVSCNLSRYRVSHYRMLQKILVRKYFPLIVIDSRVYIAPQIIILQAFLSYKKITFLQ